MIMITLGVIQEIFVSKIFVQFYFCVEKFFEVGTHENLNFSHVKYFHDRDPRKLLL